MSRSSPMSWCVRRRPRGAPALPLPSSMRWSARSSTPYSVSGSRGAPPTGSSARPSAAGRAEPADIPMSRCPSAPPVTSNLSRRRWTINSTIAGKGAGMRRSLRDGPERNDPVTTSERPPARARTGCSPRSARATCCCTPSTRCRRPPARSRGAPAASCWPRARPPATPTPSARRPRRSSPTATIATCASRPRSPWSTRSTPRSASSPAPIGSSSSASTSRPRSSPFAFRRVVD